jgi:lipoate-protein ligase B
VTSQRICRLIRLEGLTQYSEALQLQRDLARAKVGGRLADDLLILLEHHRVITLGRGASDSNVIAPPGLLQQRGVQVHEIERGGDVTYHGPGQLVGYPILDLKLYKQDLHWYLRQLEKSIIGALGDFEIVGSQVPGYTGVWVENRKIASIGVHVTRWVTFHGFALNVNTDLSDFDLIVPCGIEAVEMTSIQKETGRPFALSEVADRVAASFSSVFEVAMEPANLKSILALLSD